MGKIKDLTGRKFSKLTILEYSHKLSNSKSYWKCKCDCGNIKVIRGNDIITKKTKSCGCKSYNNKSTIKNNLIGRKFSKLVVLDRAYPKKRFVEYVCRCECNNICTVTYSNLVNNAIQTCGNCGLFVNGARISYKQIQLHKLIGKGILNLNQAQNILI